MTNTAYSADVSHESLMGQIADEYMNRLNRGERVEIDEYAERYPHLATFIRQVFPAFRVMRGSADEMDSTGLAAEPEAGMVGRLGDYRLVREIGRGGMGVVYEAEQISLGRRVALKVLPFAAVLDAKQLQRFKNEAQAAAHLQHQNIVPVYAVGCERGVHYYAMQFIEGSTLADVIHELRQLSGLDEPPESGNVAAGAPAGRSLPGTPSDVTTALASGTLCHGSVSRASLTPGSDAARLTDARTAANGSSAALHAFAPERSTKNRAFFRSVANLGVQAAEALEHAHEFGIVHRDIKPSNLLLDARGNLWITDFGLARLESDASLTMTGDVLGTLRYMSPEQAAGKNLLLDHRTDIYSLGVTLYELLTLRPAFDGRDRQELLRKIADHDPRPPRRLNPAIPADLETIVLKATAKEPQRRYATAKALTEDLQRFLLDKPIRAKRPTLMERASKWSRRHRHVVAAVMAVLLVSTIVLAVSTVLIVGQQAEIVRQRDRAEANFQKARDAVDQMLSEVARKDLADVPGMAPIRRTLLEKALEFYQGFLEEKGDDPAVRLETALAHRNVANIHAMLLQRSEQRNHQAQALRLLESLAADIADRPDQRVRLATVLTNVADLLKGSGAADAAEKKYRQAIALWTELTGDTPSSAAYQKGLAETYFSLGSLLTGAGRLAEAVETNRQALELFAALAAGSPVEQLYAFRVGECNNDIGISLAQLGQAGQAVAPMQRALQTFESLVERHPESSKYRERVGLGHFNLGLLFANMDRREEAERADRKAIDLYEKLAADFPARPDYRRRLADSLTNLGVLLWKSQRLDDAEQVFRRVLSMHEQFIEQYPAQAIFLSLAGGTTHNLAKVLDDQGVDLREVKSLFERAIAHQEAALQIEPGNAWFREYLRNHYDSLFDVLEKLGEFELAEQAVRRGLEIARELAADFPETAHYRDQFAASLYNLGNRLHKSQRFDEARTAYREALQIYTRLARDAPDVPRHRKDVADAHRQLGITLFRAGDWPAAADALQKAVELAGDDAGATEWFYLAMTRWQLGDQERAPELYARADEWTKENEPEDEELARLRAEAAELLGLNRAEAAEPKEVPPRQR